MRPEDIYRDPGGGFGSGGNSLLLPLLAIIVAVVAGYYAYGNATRVVDGFQALEEITYGQPAQVDLKEGGNVVFYEPDLGTSTVPEPSKTAFQRGLVVSGPDGPIDTSIYESSVSFSIPGFDGYAMLTLDVPEDGTYRIAPSGDRLPGQAGTLLIGRNFLRDMIEAIVGAVIALIALGVLVATLISRRDSKSRLTRQAEEAGFGLPSAEEIGELPKPPSEF